MTRDSERARQIFRAARERSEPSHADTKRVRRLLSTRLPTAAFGATGSTVLQLVSQKAAAGPALSAAAGVAAKSASLPAVLAKWTLSALAIGGAGYTVAEVALIPEPPALLPATAPIVAPSSQARPSSVASSIADVAPQSVPDASQTVAPPSLPVPPRLQQSTKPISIESEVAPPSELLLMKRAQRACRGNEPSQCLSELDSVAQHYPRGSLTEERLTLTVLALCDQGRQADAARLAQRLLTEYPNTVHVPRLRASCVGSSGQQ